MEQLKANILLVDDDQDNLLALAAALAGLNENLVTAASGKEALKRLLEDEFAVILLDVRMPEMDGFETAGVIRQRKRTRSTPIIFLTGVSTGDTHVSKAYSLGAADYLFKPVEPDILRAKVASFVELFKEKKRELQEACSAQEALMAWPNSPVPALLTGASPLHERASGLFSTLQREYWSLLETYLEALAHKCPPPREEISALAGRLGDQGAGPRDVIDLHLRVVTDQCEDIRPQRAKACTTHGRLLALEVMGYLVDYYRMGKCVFLETKE